MSADLFGFLAWRPPTFICPRCCAIFVESGNSYGNLNFWQIRNTMTSDVRSLCLKYIIREEEGYYQCRYCSIEIPSKAFHDNVYSTRLPKLESFSEVVSIAGNFPPYTQVDQMKYDPLALFFDLISSARSFIHFMTWNIDSTFLTALHIASRKLRVRGIVGTPLTGYNHYLYESLPKNENFKLNFSDSGSVNPSHTKLIVVDGIVMIDGSPNLSINAFSKTSGKSNPPGEKIRVSSNPYEVLEDHNKHFSSNWAVFNPSMDIDDY